MPVVIALVAIVALIGIANVSSLVRGNKKSAPASALSMRPATANPQQVSSFESQQQMQARRDAEERQHQQELAAAMQQLQAAESVPSPEAAVTPPMTAAQRAAIYGDSPNAPQQTSNVSQAQAEAKQKQLAREKQQQDAINSDTVANRLHQREEERHDQRRNRLR
jgi:FtsZ-interacting cell division protein ZipA